jgi:magnesium transporter
VVIVDCALYEDGCRQAGKLALEEAGDARRRDGSFVWLGVHQPSEEEFDAVRREFGLHELAVEDAVRAHQRPKLELYGDTLFVVLKTVRYVDSEEVIESGEVLLFVNSDFLVSVRHGEASALGEVRRRIEARPDLLRCGPGAVLYAIVDRVVDDYEPAAEGLEADIQEVEREVFSATPDNPAERIYYLEREVLEFHAAVAPLAPAVDRLARGHFDLISPELQTYFRDVHDHLMRVLDRIEGFRQLLSSVLHANLTQVSLRQNEVTVRQNQDMRRISAWVAILAVPTMIAGIYGMNFEHMPELRWTFGYPLVLGVIAVLCGILFWRFRKSGWL